jgi:hypothetical protein
VGWHTRRARRGHPQHRFYTFKHRLAGVRDAVLLPGPATLAASRRQGRATQHTAREQFWPTVAIKGARLAGRASIDSVCELQSITPLGKDVIAAYNPREPVRSREHRWDRIVACLQLHSGIVHSAHSASALVLGSSFQTRREPARQLWNVIRQILPVRGLMLDREG